MKTTSKKLENCRVEIKVTLKANETCEVIKSVENAFFKNTTLPGFRRGKAPQDLVRKNFADEIAEETKRSCFHKYVNDAIKAEKLEELNVSSIDDVSCTAEGGALTFTIEVKPEFKVPTYKGLKVEFRDTTVSDETVQEHLNRFRTAYATYEDAKEGEVVADGDFIQIDYTGTVDGKAITEINPEAKIVASGTGFWTQVEEGRFLPELLDAVKGMKMGETKEGIKATFDKEAAPEGLKGAKALYTLTLKTFRRRVLPTDEQFIEKTQSGSLEKLTADIREHLEKRAIEEEERRRENEAVDLLLKKVDFDVPRSQVYRAMNFTLDQFAEQAKNSGLPATYFEENREKIVKDAEEAATRQVRMWHVFEAIAKAENLEAKDDQLGKVVIKFLLDNAKK